MPNFDIRKLPKISLHDHLDGGLRPQTIIDLAAEVGHKLPADNAEDLRKWFFDSADSGSLERYLETFDHTIAVMQTPDGLKRVAREFVLDLAHDGVIYAEIRWAPEQHLQRGMTLDEVVDAVQDGLEQGMEEVDAKGGFIRTGQLVTAMRHADRGLEIAELAVRHRDNGVVALVGVDSEDHRDPCLPSSRRTRDRPAGTHQWGRSHAPIKPCRSVSSRSGRPQKGTRPRRRQGVVERAGRINTADPDTDLSGAFSFFALRSVP